MDQNHFERLTRALTAIPSRRDVLRGLTGLGLGLGVPRLPEIAEAKKKRRRKKKGEKAKPNSFGCLNVGDPCKNEGQCCSGICTGKNGNKTCRAHDTGRCSAGVRSEGCGGTRVACRTNAGALGHCATTTGNAGYCQLYSFCIACQTDADCQAADGGVLGPTAACIPCAGCPETGGTVCATADLLAGMNQDERDSGQ